MANIEHGLAVGTCYVVIDLYEERELIDPRLNWRYIVICSIFGIHFVSGKARPGSVTSPPWTSGCARASSSSSSLSSNMSSFSGE